MIKEIKAYKVNGKIYESKSEAIIAEAEEDIRTSFNLGFGHVIAYFNSDDFIEALNKFEPVIKRYYGLEVK